MRQVGGFFPGTPVSYINITDHYDITEILLKVTLNTIPLKMSFSLQSFTKRKVIYMFRCFYKMLYHQSVNKGFLFINRCQAFSQYILEITSEEHPVSETRPTCSFSDARYNPSKVWGGEGPLVVRDVSYIELALRTWH